MKSLFRSVIMSSIHMRVKLSQQTTPRNQRQVLPSPNHHHKLTHTHTQTGLSTFSTLKGIENHIGLLYSKPDRRFLRDKQVSAVRRLEEVK